MGNWERFRSFASASRTSRRSASWNGRPFRNRLLIKLKMAVFIPMPSARVRTARRVKAGDLRSWRRAKRRSIMGMGIFDLPRLQRYRVAIAGMGVAICDWGKSLGAEGKEGIDASGPTRREVAGEERECAEDHHHDGESEWVGGGGLEEQAVDGAAQGDGQDQTDGEANRGEPRAAPDDHSQDVFAFGAHGETNADLRRALAARR